jgi:hypothetical protein
MSEPSQLRARVRRSRGRLDAFAAAAVAAVIFGILVPIAASGARFPNAVEKQIVISGDAAVSAAALLNLPSSGPSSISLKLGRNDAWAVYLLKHDTKQELSNGDGPARYNLVKFSRAPIATLTIAPYWLDLGTQLPETKAGYYAFDSPFISEDLSSNDPWAKLLRHLKNESGWNGNARPQLQRCVTSREQTELCFSVYGAKDYAHSPERNGYVVRIAAHPPTY